MFSSITDQLSKQPHWVSLPTILGFIIFSKHLLTFLLWLFAALLRRPKSLAAAYGPWAAVTGATDGIGKALSFQLAAQGLDLLLLGRNPKKLQSVKSEIESRFPNTRIKTVVADLAGSGHSGAAGEIEEAIGGLEVGVLVNSAGVTYPAARFFHEVEEEVWRNVVGVNLEGITRVTRAALPGMLRRKRGAIVNLGSGAGIVVPSHPLFSIYSATKAYVDQLSRSLSVEYESHGIHVQCQVPLYVATKMVEYKRPSFFTPSAEEYAKAAIRCIGHERRCMPYWPHSVQWLIASFFPDAVLDFWRLSIGIRRRGIV